MEQNQVAISQQQGVSIYADLNSFENAQRICKMLCTSTLVPKEYQNNLPNTMIAYEMSVRTGMSVFMVMQNLDIIQGRPSWASKYVIAALNSCGRFSPLQFEYKDLGEKTVNYIKTEGYGQNRTKKAESIIVRDQSCRAYARNVHGEVIYGPTVTIEMAVKEGWYTKQDSKWPNMPEVMLSYRSAKFFGNLYAPDVLMGMLSSDEVEDITDLNHQKESITQTSAPIQILNEKVKDPAATPEAVVVGAQPRVSSEANPNDDEELV